MEGPKDRVRREAPERRGEGVTHCLWVCLPQCGVSPVWGPPLRIFEILHANLTSIFIQKRGQKFDVFAIVCLFLGDTVAPFLLGAIPQNRRLWE